jgi:hypothetical protein
VTRREKFLGVAVVVLLLFGLWWIFANTSSYTVVALDVYSSFEWTDRVYTPTHAEVHGVREGRPVSVFVGPHSGFEAITESAYLKQIELRNGSPEYPDADQNEVANAVVVCGVPEDCRWIAANISQHAKAREKHD